MPLIVDLPTAARLELGTSTSPACQRRWEEGIDVSLARLRIPRGQPGFDAYPFLAGVPSPLHPLNSTVLLVHIGKTGGSTVATTLHKAGIRNDAVHAPRPAEPVPCHAPHRGEHPRPSRTLPVGIQLGSEVEAGLGNELLGVLRR